MPLAAASDEDFLTLQFDAPRSLKFSMSLTGTSTAAAITEVCRVAGRPNGIASHLSVS